VQSEGKLGPKLRQFIQDKPVDELVDVNIFLTAEPASFLRGGAASLEAMDRATAVSQITQGVNAYQRPLVGFLEQNNAGSVRRFWLNNTVGVEVPIRLLSSIAEREDVRLIELSVEIPFESLIEPEGEPKKKAIHRKTTAAPPDPRRLWNLQRIEAANLWDLVPPLTGEGVVVAVLDSGINYNHPDLTGVMWDGLPAHPHHGYNFADANDDPMDDAGGHGTKCAGVIAGARTGVAPGARLMAVRIGGVGLYATERTFWDGMTFAVEHGCHILSMSMVWPYDTYLGWYPDYDYWRRASETLYCLHIVHVNSAGNQYVQLATSPIPYNVGAPANCPPPWLSAAQIGLCSGGQASAITCGASQEGDDLEPSSSWGPAEWSDYHWPPGLIKPDVCAPGSNICTCTAAGASSLYRHDFSQTSAATPHVAGTIALLMHACQRAGTTAVPARFLEALESSCVPMTGQVLSKENGFGSGRISARAAYEFGRARGWW